MARLERERAMYKSEAERLAAEIERLAGGCKHSRFLLVFNPTSTLFGHSSDFIIDLILVVLAAGVVIHDPIADSKVFGG